MEVRMAKTATLSIRVDEGMKAELESRAEKDGRSLASYVERILARHHSLPAWQLRDPQPHHRKKVGPQVSLSIAEGWPVAVMSANNAQALGEQLIRVAQLAKKLPPAE
jgi:hypothetical protein